ncbi:ATP-binding protein, partial [Candidatus Woesearchaeota archaeon]|nr:ATP-binding protein [Candidatus Woesearchaeota archaeon]
PTSCFYIRTDSSSINACNKIFSDFIWPAARSQAYDEDTLELCLEESYVNAITHGNQGGCDSLYTTRDLPVPANLAQNKKKPVEVEFIMNEKCYALRVTDTGEGFDKSKVQLGKDGNLMALSGRGLFLIQCYSDCMVFTKQESPQKFSISMVKFK